MRMVPTSLAGRLVATVVALAIATSVLLGVLSTLAMRGVLNGQLDEDVKQTLERSEHRAPGFPGPAPEEHDGDFDGDGDGARIHLGVGHPACTLSARYDACAHRGEVIPASGQRRSLSNTALDILRTVPVDGRSHV